MSLLGQFLTSPQPSQALAYGGGGTVGVSSHHAPFTWGRNGLHMHACP